MTGRFRPGQSGNPAGKALARANRATIALEKILQDESENIVRKAVELAQNGDTVAMRLCLDRLIPVRKDRPITFTLPAIDTPGRPLRRRRTRCCRGWRPARSLRPRPRSFRSWSTPT